METIESASLNSSAENRVIETKKVRGTVSAASNAIVGMSAHQEDRLIAIALFSISRSYQRCVKHSHYLDLQPDPYRWYRV